MTVYHRLAALMTHGRMFGSRILGAMSPFWFLTFLNVFFPALYKNYHHFHILSAMWCHNWKLVTLFFIQEFLFCLKIRTQTAPAFCKLQPQYFHTYHSIAALLLFPALNTRHCCSACSTEPLWDFYFSPELQECT